MSAPSVTALSSNKRASVSLHDVLVVPKEVCAMDAPKHSNEIPDPFSKKHSALYARYPTDSHHICEQSDGYGDIRKAIRIQSTCSLQNLLSVRQAP